MNPIYRFELSIDGENSQVAFPVYKDDVEISFEQESNQEFFRRKLTGKLVFIRGDYQRIVGASFDAEFGLSISISYDAGQTWTAYWDGTFFKTDCSFDMDNESVTVTPSVKDPYTAVLAGLEKEYDLIQLAPEINAVKLDKRPMIQVYVPGQTTIGCFLSGMWWEQECEAVTDINVLTQTGNGKPNFVLNNSLRVVSVSGNGTPIIPDVFIGTIPTRPPSGTLYEEFTYSNNGYTVHYIDHIVGGGGGGTRAKEWEIIRNSDNVRLWYAIWSAQSGYEETPYEVVLSPVSGTGAVGEITLYVSDMRVYSRMILDKETFNGSQTYTLPDDDLVGDNRNYHRVIGYAIANTVDFSTRLSETPTQWGIYQPGLYYQEPFILSMPEFFPIARNSWGRVSVWFRFSSIDWILEKDGRAEYTMKDAYPLWSVISVLLEKIAPGISHLGTVEYSEFLYGVNRITNISQQLLITPKSNVVSSGYDEPARRAPITFATVMNMLRDCFRCYWFIDSQGRFRIEHIKFFENGMSYDNTPVVGIDLTKRIQSRNGKPWSFGRNQYQYEKPEMAARYQFGWMDNATRLFDGYPIDIISKYVNPDNIEQIDVGQFSSDIDYILLNPGDVSKDGFVLMAGIPASETSGESVETDTEGSDILFDFDLAPFVGQSLTITLKSTIANVRVFQTDGNTLISRIGDIATANVETSFTFDVQDGMKRISVWGGGNVGTVSLLSVIASRPKTYLLPYLEFYANGSRHILQNAYVAFVFLQQYYLWDLPAWKFEINGIEGNAYGVKKLKTQQITFPAKSDPELTHLIRTEIGTGTIQKLSVNLSSRGADVTLKFEFER